MIYAFLLLTIVTLGKMILMTKERAIAADLKLAQEIAALKDMLIIDDREKIRIERRLSARGKHEKDKATLDRMSMEFKIKRKWRLF